MRLRRYLIVVALIFMVVTFMRGNVSAYNMAEYFPLNQGDEWTYAFTLNGNTIPPLEVFIDGTELVNGVETIKYTMSSPVPNEDDYFCYTIDSEGLKQHKWYWATFGTYSIFDSPRIEFPAQFDVGEVYEEPYSYKTYSIDDDSLVGTYTGSETVTLELVKEVIVPAGTFKDCLKVSILASAQFGDWTEGFDEILWLARRVGMVKHHTTNYQRHPVEEDIEIIITHELSDYNVEIPDDCLATFALGEDSNDLKTLRKFRDEVLSKTLAGQEIIRLYYEWSPVIVKAIEGDEKFKEEAKEMVDGILQMIRGM